MVYLRKITATHAPKNARILVMNDDTDVLTAVKLLLKTGGQRGGDGKEPGIASVS